MFIRVTHYEGQPRLININEIRSCIPANPNHRGPCNSIIYMRTENHNLMALRVEVTESISDLETLIKEATS